jgi:hypothetical protein
MGSAADPPATQSGRQVRAQIVVIVAVRNPTRSVFM